MKKLIFVLLFLSFCSIANAQATGNSKFIWTQPNETASSANQLTYKYYPDSGSVGTVLTSVTCTGTTTITCTVNFPAFTPGQHSIQVSASNAAGESPKSDPFNFTFVIVPAKPINLGIQPPT